MLKQPSFLISLLALALLAGLAVFLKTDMSGSIVAIVSAFLTAQTTRKASHVWAASKDPQASTAEAIKHVEEKS